MNIEKLKESLIHSEGLKHFVYTCPKGFLTIGVGRNLETRGLKKAEILYLLENDILDSKLHLEDIFQNFNNLNDVRQNVLIEMVFNLGLGGFKKFKKLIEAVRNEDFIIASNEMINSKWHNDFINLRSDKNDKLTRSYKLSQQMLKGAF